MLFFCQIVVFLARALEAKVAGIESFQRLVLDQPDDVVLEFIKDVRRQLREQGS